MSNKIQGLHHITAIAGKAQRNYDFYTQTLGLRLVKKTVNFDDPGTYHFYYGNENGTPGTILTFFPWTYVKRGTNGNGLATEIGYSIPKDSLDFWLNRFKETNTKHAQPFERLGEIILPFQDPDGLELNLIVPAADDNRAVWETKEIKKDTATRGFHNIVLALRNAAPTAKVLTDIFGYTLQKQENGYLRFITDAVDTANIVDILEDPTGKPGVGGGGTNHHVAFRVKNEEELMAFRETIAMSGFNITPKIDRNYFYSLYFREPGGILFEIATDNPGFAVDEPVNELGTHLKLPAQYESRRAEIEGFLPVLTQ